ncbi:MAG: YidC/Oxa1 family membrane protein insertase, partial [Agathobacter sp.]|nr:YidC/Oxa1 family membrane protein insertase [Agathobacter sp.]
IEEFNQFNFFLGMNISDTPWNIITSNFNSKNYLAMIVPFAIPVIYYFVNKISLKLSMASTNKNNNSNDMMTKQMESMNKTMPIMMVFFCFITPVGLGIYWIVSAAYRALQQFLLNKHFDKMDYNVIIEKNKEKAKKKQEKRGVYENQIREAAAVKTRTIESKANIKNYADLDSSEYTNTNRTYKEGSMAAKANMVREYNERNSRK